MSCPSANCQGTEPEMAVRVPITKSERAMITVALKALDASFGNEIVTKLNGTRCKHCGGSGFAPYVGGDDDEAPCEHCHRSGFELRRWT